MGLHYYHGGADPYELATLAKHSDLDVDPPEGVEEIVDVANEHGYVIKGLLLEDANFASPDD